MLGSNFLSWLLLLWWLCSIINEFDLSDCKQKWIFKFYQVGLLIGIYLFGCNCPCKLTLNRPRSNTIQDDLVNLFVHGIVLFRLVKMGFSYLIVKCMLFSYCPRKEGIYRVTHRFPFYMCKHSTCRLWPSLRSVSLKYIFIHDFVFLSWLFNLNSSSQVNFAFMMLWSYWIWLWGINPVFE